MCGFLHTEQNKKLFNFCLKKVCIYVTFIFARTDSQLRKKYWQINRLSHFVLEYICRLPKLT